MNNMGFLSLKYGNHSQLFEERDDWSQKNFNFKLNVKTISEL